MKYFTLIFFCSHLLFVTSSYAFLFINSDGYKQEIDESTLTELDRYVWTEFFNRRTSITELEVREAVNSKIYSSSIRASGEFEVRKSNYSDEIKNAYFNFAVKLNEAFQTDQDFYDQVTENWRPFYEYIRECAKLVKDIPEHPKHDEIMELNRTIDKKEPWMNCTADWKPRSKTESSWLVFRAASDLYNYSTPIPNTEKLITKIFPLRHLTTNDESLLRVLKEIAPEATMSVHSETNVLIITGKGLEIQKIQEYLLVVDSYTCDSKN